MTLRQKLIHVHVEDSKHFYVLFGKKLRRLSRLSIYLKYRDSLLRMQTEVDSLAEALAGLDKRVTDLEASFKLRVLFNGANHINKERVNSAIENHKGSGLNQTPRAVRIVVSLTSFPERMYDIHYCLFSLLTQTLKPDMVVLWLAPEQFPRGEEDIPQKVLDMKRFGLSIGWHHDIKSYKKLVPSLTSFPEDVIVTADDDLYYPSDWLESLYREYDGSPDLICHRAHRIRITDGKVSPYSDWDHCIQNAAPSPINFPTSGAGVLFPPHSLHEDITREHLFLALAPTADDVWFWAMALLAGREIKTVKSDLDDHHSFSRELCYVNPQREFELNGEHTLYSINRDNNDTQLAAVIKAYPDLKRIITEAASN